MIESDWYKLYGEGWKGEIVDEAFTHPAKYSRALIRNIYDHAVGEGWLVDGDRVVDPFGGVALGGLDAMRHGLHWCGVELEPRFVDLGNQNIDLWNTRYAAHFNKWGTARLLQGDSRSFDFEACGCAVSSPPYSEARVGRESGQEQCGRGDQYGGTNGQIGGAPDFWLAARDIVSNVYLALRPGGHAIFVVKGFVKNKAYVDFPDQWRELCESIGFVTLHWHRAWLVEEGGSQYDLFGGMHTKRTERKSFFRRLAEKNGSPRVDYEVVLCMEKPDGYSR